MGVHHWRRDDDGVLRCVLCRRMHRNTSFNPFGDQHELIDYLRCEESEAGEDEKRRPEAQQGQSEGRCPG